MANPMNIAGGVMSGVNMLGNLIAGGIQMKRGKEKLNSLVRPEFEIPKGVEEAGTIARLNATNPFLPGQSLIEQNIQQGTAQTAANVRDMGGVSDLYMAQIGQNQAMNEVGVQAAQNRLQQQMNLLNQIAQENEYDMAKQDWEKFIPFQEKRQEALAQIGAGQQNIGNMLNMLGIAGAGMIGMEAKTKGSQNTLMSGQRKQRTLTGGLMTPEPDANPNLQGWS